MSRICEVCGKKTTFGNQMTIRGKAKYLGGVGTKITGISPRQFKPNIQKVRALVDGVARRLRVCTACIRNGVVIKRGPRPDQFKTKVSTNPAFLRGPIPQTTVPTMSAPVAEASTPTAAT